jgi:hypothetical protein
LTHVANIAAAHHPDKPPLIDNQIRVCYDQSVTKFGFKLLNYTTISSALVLAFLVLGCASMGTEAHMKKPAGQGPISDTLAKNQSALERCIPQSISLNSGESLKLILTFVRQADGSVDDADIERMSAPDPDFRDCILRKLQQMQFPPTDSGLDEKVRYPLIFVQSVR